MTEPNPDIRASLREGAGPVGDIRSALGEGAPGSVSEDQQGAQPVGGKNIFGKMGGLFGKAGEKIGNVAGGVGELGGSVLGGTGGRIEAGRNLLGSAAEKLGDKLQNQKIFGRPSLSFLAEMGAGMVASTAAKTVAKELIINTLGSAATGVVGRVAIGAAAGAAVGAGKEYLKQVRDNFQMEVIHNGERKRFLENFKPSDCAAIGKAALKGAVFGAVGGAIAAVAMDMWESASATGQLPPDVPPGLVKPDVPPGLVKPDVPPGLVKPDVPPAQLAPALSGVLPTEPAVEPITETTPPVTLQGLTDRGEGLRLGGYNFTPEQISKIAADQATDRVNKAIEEFGESIPLSGGSNPWQVSTDILKSALGHEPTPVQIMELDKVICQQNGISVPNWGIVGNIDHRFLPAGFPIKLDDEVKKALWAIVKK